jgi:Fur family ferric uptake transcriptional regulator
MTHDDFAFIKLLQSRGLRVTPQRLQVLDAVCEGEGHTSAGEVLARAREANPAIDQSTVYRTLELLCKLGVVAANLSAEGITVYELVGERPHHHLVCTTCGREYEIPDQAVQTLMEAIQGLYGFTVTTHHLMLEGLCQACLTSEESQVEP